MMITIAPLTVNPNYKHITSRIEHEKEGYNGKNLLPIIYWGIYIDDKYISYTSSKELAEKTKVWIEKWLEDRL